MKTVNKSVSDLKPYEKNAKKHEAKQIENVAKSIKEFGFVQPIVIDKDDVIIIGHCRYEASKKLGLIEVPCLKVEDLTEEQVNMLRIVDNKTNESAWDLEMLKSEINELDFHNFDFDFGFQDETEDEKKYNAETPPMEYEITGDAPLIDELYNLEKTELLQKEINEADVAVEIKRFLIEATHRHTVFNYGNIAEFYAQADKKVQELFEKSGLVIIDKDSAIANGYVKLSKTMNEIRKAEKNEG